MVPWHMQGWTPVPASQHALSTAHGSFLKSRPPGKRVAGKRDPRAAGVWWGQRDLRLVPQGHESEKHHCDTNSMNYDFWGQAVAYD